MSNNYSCCNGCGDYCKITIPAVKLVFHIKALASGHMPYYAGSVLRGMIGKEIRNLSCVNKDAQCEHCPYIRNCAYGKLFEPLSSVFAPELTKTQLYLTPPFVIEAPFFPEQQWEKDEIKPFQLIIFGDALHYIHYFIESLFFIAETGLGKQRIPFVIERIEQYLENGETVKLLHDDTVLYDRLQETNFSWETEQNCINKILINIETPLRIQEEGQIVRGFNVELFLKNCERRLQFFKKAYGIVLECSNAGFSHFANNIKMTHKHIAWTDWERYSSRNKKTMNLGGILGSFQLEGGVLTSVLPLLQFASFAHIGKQTVFGLGKFTIWKELS